MTPEEAVEEIKGLLITLGRGRTYEALRALLAERETLEASEGVLMAKLQTAEQRAEAAEVKHQTWVRRAEAAEAQLEHERAVAPAYAETCRLLRAKLDSVEARLREVEAELQNQKNIASMAEHDMHQAEARLREVEADRDRLQGKLDDLKQGWAQEQAHFEHDAELRDKVIEAIRATDAKEWHEQADAVLDIREIREALEARAALAAAQARIADVRAAIERGREKRPYLGWGDQSPDEAVAGAVGQILLDMDEILSADTQVAPANLADLLRAAQAQVAALVEWARKSGHRAGCDALRNWERDCDCGLRALLASRPGGSGE